MKQDGRSLNLPKMDEFGFPETIRDITFEEAKVGFGNGKYSLHVDKGLALQASASGLPTPFSAAIAGFVFIPSFLLPPVLWYFVSFPAAIFAAFLPIVFFKYSRWQCVRSVQKHTFSSKRMFDILLRNQVIWFQET